MLRCVWHTEQKQKEASCIQALCKPRFPPFPRFPLLYNYYYIFLLFCTFSLRFLVLCLQKGDQGNKFDCMRFYFWGNTRAVVLSACSLRWRRVCPSVCVNVSDTTLTLYCYSNLVIFLVFAISTLFFWACM